MVVRRLRPRRSSGTRAHLRRTAGRAEGAVPRPLALLIFAVGFIGFLVLLAVVAGLVG